MKIIIYLFAAVIICGHSFAAKRNSLMTRGDSVYTKLKGEYFGQKPPGMVPEVFAPGIISDAGYRLHSFPAFSPDGKEVFWAVIPPMVLHMKLDNGYWTKPVKAPFSEGNIQAPVFSPDGNRIYFQVNKKEGLGSNDIWYAERSNGKWGRAQNPGSPLNSQVMETQPSVTNNGTIYFTGSMQNTTWSRGIYFSRFVDGKYSQPCPLGKNINTVSIDMYPFISPDEKILVFSSSRPGSGEKDLKLYFSSRDGEGKWKEPVNISEKLGLKSGAKFGCLSHDGKYLFFLMEGKIYWVDSKILK